MRSFSISFCPSALPGTLHTNTTTHFNSQDLRVELSGLVGRDRRGDDGSGHTASTAQSRLGGDKDVWDVLVLTEERQVEDDLDGLDIGGHDDELADTSVEGLSGLVSTGVSGF